LLPESKSSRFCKILIFLFMKSVLSLRKLNCTGDRDLLWSVASVFFLFKLLC
jgi:hypothetical protein